jgi:hypothetical protein
MFLSRAKPPVVMPGAFYLSGIKKAALAEQPLKYLIE